MNRPKQCAARGVNCPVTGYKYNDTLEVSHSRITFGQNYETRCTSTHLISFMVDDVKLSAQTFHTIHKRVTTTFLPTFHKLTVTSVAVCCTTEGSNTFPLENLSHICCFHSKASHTPGSHCCKTLGGKN